MAKQVSVLVGAGSIGQAVIRRVSAGKHVVAGPYDLFYASSETERMKTA